MKLGRKIDEDIDIDSERLVQCTFRTSAYNKYVLVQRAKASGQTLSEELNDIMNFSIHEEEIEKKYNRKFKIFIENIAKKDPLELERLMNLWVTIK